MLIYVVELQVQVVASHLAVTCALVCRASGVILCHCQCMQVDNIFFMCTRGEMTSPFWAGIQVVILILAGAAVTRIARARPLASRVTRWAQLARLSWSRPPRCFTPKESLLRVSSQARPVTPSDLSHNGTAAGRELLFFHFFVVVLSHLFLRPTFATRRKALSAQFWPACRCNRDSDGTGVDALFSLVAQRQHVDGRECVWWRKW